MTGMELLARAEALVSRETVYTIAGNKATVTVTKANVCGIVTYEIEHPCFITPRNPKGRYMHADLEVIGRYARKIAQEGDAFA